MCNVPRPPIERSLQIKKDQDIGSREELSMFKNLAKGKGMIGPPGLSILYCQSV